MTEWEADFVINRRSIMPYVAVAGLLITKRWLDSAGHAARDLRDVVRPRPQPLVPLPVVALGMLGIGAVVMFLLDPERGRDRRAGGRERLQSGLRLVQEEAAGVREKVAHLGQGTEPVEDAVLISMVRGELSRDHVFASSNLLIDATDGRVTLRGELEHPEDIRRMEKLAKRVAGVRSVDNQLQHTGASDLSQRS